MGRIRYARVSTVEQNADLPHAALTAAGCGRIFTDHGVSGTTASRPEFDKLLDHLRSRDEVVVWKLTCLVVTPATCWPSSMTWNVEAVAPGALPKASAPQGRGVEPCSPSCLLSPNSSATSSPSGPGQAWPQPRNTDGKPAGGSYH